MNSKERIENIAAASAAYVLHARVQRRDFNRGDSIRDFDLVFDDRPDEPLEVKQGSDQIIVNTFARFRRASRSVPSLTHVWTINVWPKLEDPAGDAPYDVERFYRDGVPALEELERHGYKRFVKNASDANPVVDAALAALEELGCNYGQSDPLPAGEAARIHLTSVVGGYISPDISARIIERMANEHNLEKLREPLEAERRHLFVFAADASTLAWGAIDPTTIGRLPEIPEPTTTAWISRGDRLLVCTPPAGWELHEIPQDVLDHPEDWIDQ